MIRRLGVLFGFLARYARLRLALSLSSASPVEGRPLGKILVLGYAAIGDFVFFLPALEALRDAYPKARVTLLANSYPTTEELLPASDLADEIWRTKGELPDPAEAAELKEKIREGGFDAVVASHAAPIGFWADALTGIPLRVGHVHELEGDEDASDRGLGAVRRAIVGGEFERRAVLNRRVPIRRWREHMVPRNLRLIEALGGEPGSSESSRPRLPETEASRGFAADALPPKEGVGTVGVHVGSRLSQYRKIWPAERWGEVCRLLGETYPLRFALLGGPDEEDIPERFAAGIKGPYVDLVRKGGLIDAFSVMRRCDLFLSNDTGLAKAAMAMRVPTATVWGPSDRYGWGVFWDEDIHLEILHEVPCSPCVRLGFPREGAGVLNFSNCGHHDCLEKLSPQDVFDAIRKRYGALLERSGA